MVFDVIIIGRDVRNTILLRAIQKALPELFSYEKNPGKKTKDKQRLEDLFAGS